eukprot:5856160-Prymnesium_polylepis.1
MGNTVEVRRCYIEYFGYLPLAHERPGAHYKLVSSMTVFIGSYAVMSASGAAAAASHHPLTVAVILGADCVLHHAGRMWDGEWSTHFGIVGRDTVLATCLDLVFNTLFWLLMHAVPVPLARDPNWVGPHHSCRIVLL